MYSGGALAQDSQHSKRDSSAAGRKSFGPPVGMTGGCRNQDVVSLGWQGKGFEEEMFGRRRRA